MLILYGNIFKVTRNRLPPDVRLRCSDRLQRAQVTAGKPLIPSVKRQPSTASMKLATRVQLQTNHSEISSASSDGSRRFSLSRDVSARNSECFEMINVRERPQPDVQGPHSSCGRPVRSLTVQRVNNSPESASTSITARPSLANLRYTSPKDEWRRTAGVAAGEGVARRENKAAKTLAIVVGGFVICWLPFFILYVVEPFCFSCRVSDTVRGALTWLGYANSLVNPFIYATYNRHFRQSFWHLTIGRFHSCLPIPSRLNNVPESRATL